MFTGLIEEVGTVVAMRASDGGARLQIAAPCTAKEATSGKSIAVNGCCLTLTSRRKDRLTFDLLEETIARTNLNRLRQNSQINLEAALRADGRLGGHFIQGNRIAARVRTLCRFKRFDRYQWNQPHGF